MRKDTPEAALPEFSAAAQKEWNGHVEAVLRGIAHALNNRAAALSAVIQLTTDDEPPSLVRSILDTELERVSGLATVVRSVGTPRQGEEAFSPGDAVTEATDVLRLHSEQRDAITTIESAAVAPVRLHRWMFVRALVVLGVSAGRAGPQGRVTLRDDGDALEARIEGVTATPSVYVGEIASAMGGQAVNGGTGFRVPSLSAIRQREDS